eukprot:TRINITY_DN5363_c0_g1_i2.p1 TRINITY_DN5363_c0_g1~~TRINITY_DN5363_c0_g1_i2.p1  ORF type:complete len:406 (-),score=86.60 TRINITY_DN5363_c0_g1_i2:131-1348(-)
MARRHQLIQRAFSGLNNFAIEVPSWGFADTGTRFGKFFQDAAAVDFQDKLSDASHVHKLTKACPTMAVHVLWDFPDPKNKSEITRVDKLAREQFGIRIGSINPNLFQDQRYKFGSFGNNHAEIRKQALDHCFDCIEIGKIVSSEYVSMWFADGTNYPGQANLRHRKQWFQECLAAMHQKMDPSQILLVEYKPFEPAFYHTDVADWGMSYVLCKKSGPQAKVLVDTGHHYQAQNIEQIVAWLLDEEMLGGFHFNDRRYADDDLTIGSIDPYQIFRIFYEIHAYAYEKGSMPEIGYMIDQSHNLKPKIEATIQTVMMAQELYVKAALVDFEVVKRAQDANNIVDAELELKRAFFTDVSGILNDWRTEHQLDLDPLEAHRKSGYTEAAANDRNKKRQERGIVRGGSYA